MYTQSQLTPVIGHPGYGCFISRDKTLTNFDDDVDITNIAAALKTGAIVLFKHE
jgi:hypothetical protein